MTHGNINDFERMYNSYYFFLFLIVFFTPHAFALNPAEILVVANKRMRESETLANFYMQRRRIPRDNLVLLSCSLKETVSREEYLKQIRTPIREKITQLSEKQKISAIVTMYGVPLKVMPPEPSWEEKDKILDLRKKLEKVDSSGGPNDEKNKRKKILQRMIGQLQHESSRAAVDSELSLIKIAEYNLSGWIANPYLSDSKKDPRQIPISEVVLVSRLDGPDEQIVKRIIDDSYSAEASGLDGIAYIDARWQKSVDPKVAGYALYDLSLYNAAEVIAATLEVKIDTRETLFPEHSCPRAAIYCGWYSLSRYVDSFSWEKGAVAYHIASDECASLREQDSLRWCVQLLQRGVAATIGPVYEPYVEGFPLPELFFGNLIEKKMSLGDAFLHSLPYLSWQIILVGDPLYTPFQ